MLEYCSFSVLLLTTLAQPHSWKWRDNDVTHVCINKQTWCVWRMIGH